MTRIDKVRHTMASTKSWLTTKQISERVGGQIKNVHLLLLMLAASGTVDRRTAGSGRDIEWKGRTPPLDT